MLFLVISNPRPEPPAAVAAVRRRFWDWVAPLRASGEVRTIYARVGRGAVAVFDVPAHEVLHRRLTEWQEMIPAEFEVLPLIDPDAAQQFLRGDYNGPSSDKE